MALQFNYNFDKVGVESSTAYAKISIFSGDKDNISFHVDVYVNQAARDSNKGPLSKYDFIIPAPSGTGNDLLVDLYNHLKNLPEFSGSTDI